LAFIKILKEAFSVEDLEGRLIRVKARLDHALDSSMESELICKMATIEFVMEVFKDEEEEDVFQTLEFFIEARRGDTDHGTL
jgi:hypothetical protein